MFKKIRVTLLLYILLIVVAYTALSRIRTTNWQQPLTVVIHPINGDGSLAAMQYIKGLHEDSFINISKFMARQAEDYMLETEQPVEFYLGTKLNTLPPERPKASWGLPAILWSLQLRYYAWQQGRQDPADIRLFVVYFDPNTHPALAHSTGLQKGLVGVINAFASNAYRGSNHVIIAHELLHTVGATDKYDFATGYPLYPEGFAEPDKQPQLPQRYAEIMGGRIPVTQAKSEIPTALQQVVIGEKTAQEINWLK